MDDKKKTSADDKITERENCEELLLFADDCEATVKSKDFFTTGTPEDEDALTCSIEQALLCLKELYAMDYTDIDKPRVLTLIRIYIGRALISFVSRVFPKILVSKSFSDNNQINEYMNSRCRASADDIEERLALIEQYVSLCDKDEFSPYFTKRSGYIGLEDGYFDAFRKYALGTLRVLYDMTIADFNPSYSLIKSGDPTAKEKTAAAIKQAERVLPTLRWIMRRSLDTVFVDLTGLLTASLCRNCSAGYHNLAICAENEIRSIGQKKEHRSPEHDELQRQARTARLREQMYAARTHTYSYLLDRHGRNDKVKNFVKDTLNMKADLSLMKHIDLFHTAISLGGEHLDFYLDNQSEKGLLHWFNGLKPLWDRADETLGRMLSDIAGFLTSHLDDIRVKRILYFSNFYETLAIAYAYNYGCYEISEKIIYNGYDYYLELSTLWLIFRFNRPAFESEIKKLKAICLERALKCSADDYYATKKYIRTLYGDEFVDEFRRIAESSLAEIDRNDDKDPRNRDGRITPEWARNQKR